MVVRTGFPLKHGVWAVARDALRCRKWHGGCRPTVCCCLFMWEEECESDYCIPPASLIWAAAECRYVTCQVTLSWPTWQRRCVFTACFSRSKGTFSVLETPGSCVSVVQHSCLHSYYFPSVVWRKGVTCTHKSPYFILCKSCVDTNQISFRYLTHSRTERLMAI